MSSEKWRIERLRNLCSYITDGKHGDCRNQDNSGYYFLSAKDVIDGKLSYENARQITKEDFQDTHKRTQLEPFDILLTNSGTIGRMALAPDHDLTSRTTFQKSVALLKPIKEKIFPAFLYYCLIARKTDIVNIASGTTQQNLLLGDLRSFEIEIPESMETQRRIAEILSALDDKIELNRRMNGTLESLARAVFREWFVDNEEAKGWKVGKLGDVAQNIKRGVNSDQLDPMTSYIGLEHMPRASIALSEWGNASELASNKFIFKQGEFLFGKLRPYFHKVGIAPIDGVCSTDILVIVPKLIEWYGFVLEHISSVELINYTNAASTGTKMPRTNWSDIANYEITIPPVKLVKEFNVLILPIVEQILANIKQSRTLAELRDTLLPKLMSGEVRVADLPEVEQKTAC